MLHEVDKLAPGFSTLRHSTKSDGDSSSDAESIDGESDGADGPGPIFSPSIIPAYDNSPRSDALPTEKYREEVLLSFFAGWAIAHAHLHRKFVAITPVPASTEWGHVSEEFTVLRLS
jgi:hypothetical protein